MSDVQSLVVLLGKRENDSYLLADGRKIRCGYSEPGGMFHPPGEHYGTPAVVIGYRGNNAAFRSDVGIFLSDKLPAIMPTPREDRLHLIAVMLGSHFVKGGIDAWIVSPNSRPTENLSHLFS